MRIKYVMPFTFGAADETSRASQVPTGILAPDTVVDCVAGRNTGGFLQTYYEALLFDMYIAESGLRAEDEGYDAVVMDTVSDSGLAALRSKLSILVLGPGLVSYAVAVLLGKRFSIVTVWDSLQHIYDKNLDTYDMHDKCASIRSAGLDPDVEALASGRTLVEIGQDEMFTRVTAAGRQAVEVDGADVLVLGSTTMHAVGDHMQAELGVPVINPGPVALKMAETLVGLGLGHSKSAYPAPALDLDGLFFALPSAV